MINPGQGRGPKSGTAGGSNSNPFPANLRVLVVDDDPTCLIILERMLRTCLYRVTKCNSAEQALSLLRKNKNGFDIVITDVHMPGRAGPEGKQAKPLLVAVNLIYTLSAFFISKFSIAELALSHVHSDAWHGWFQPPRTRWFRDGNLLS